MSKTFRVDPFSRETVKDFFNKPYRIRRAKSKMKPKDTTRQEKRNDAKESVGEGDFYD